LSIVDHHAIDLSPRISEAGVADYIALLKPRVMSLVVFTALVGLVIAPVTSIPSLRSPRSSALPWAVELPAR
jgi:heme O synthase-like polyprenyltransferase